MIDTRSHPVLNENAGKTAEELPTVEEEHPSSKPNATKLPDEAFESIAGGSMPIIDAF